MILVGYWSSPFARRVGVTMKLLDIPFEHRPWASSHGAALRAVNPVGRVPALILDDGETLIDSTMILDYVDELAGPERALTSPRGPARRRVNRLVALAVGACEKYVAAYYERSKRPAEKVHQPWLDQLEGQVATALQALDAEAALAAPWLLGERVTQADVTTACAVLSMRYDLAHLVPPGRYPNLDALVDRADALPAFRETVPT
ncbi:MAG: glutathione S-transferase family protein [Alphaproteobacteria bacterium]|nr:glutathione S-transferase family protein [Alphaproteobacteria bacterium]